MTDVSAQRPSSESDFAFHQSQIFDLHVKSGSDEGLWAETSSIYINYQHLCGLHRRESSWERSSQLQN